MSEAGQSQVLVLASTFPRRAGDTTPPFVLRLCQAMQKEGWQSVVVAPHAAGLATRELLEGVECRRFRYAPAALERLAYGGGMLANIRAARWLWLVLPFFLLALLVTAGTLLVRRRIYVVHAHWIVPQGLVAALLRRIVFWRRMHLVMTAHGGDLHADMGGLARRLMRWAMRQADVLAVVSEDMRRLAIEQGVPEHRVVVASMGVDTTQFQPPPSDGERSGIVFVGRLVDKKGVHHLLEAFGLLRQQEAGLRLTIVGDGPLRGTLEAQAERLCITGSVTFAGARPPAEIPGFFQRAALFVMPSVVADSGDQEGLGLVAAEAMSCGCPVVAHDIPAVRDLVLHGQTGLLVPAGNRDALAAAMRRLLDDRALASRLAQAGRQHVAGHYSWPAVAGRYRKLYEAGPEARA